MSSNGTRRRSKSRDRRDRKDYYKSKPRKYSDEGTKLYLSNISSNVNEKRLIEEFRKFGEVNDARIKKKTNKGTYFGYVIMKSRSSAELAMNNINKQYGWKVSLNDFSEDYYRASPSESREKNRGRKSRSRSRSRSYSKKQQINAEEQAQSVVTEQPRKEEETFPTSREGDFRPFKVREIWVGNLPSNISEQMIYNNFFIYGEISKIDFHPDKNYAFIRYRLCVSASRAYEKAKNMNLGGNAIRISFSDSGKRKEIIGDEPGYELNETNCRLLHVSLNRNFTIAPENNLKEIFKQYGQIKALNTKSSFGYRPSIYVEYYKSEDAAKAIEGLSTGDPNGEKRGLLGDPQCEINYYYKKKATNDAPMNMTPNMMFPNMNMPIMSGGQQPNLNMMQMMQMMNYQRQMMANYQMNLMKNQGNTNNINNNTNSDVVNKLPSSISNQSNLNNINNDTKKNDQINPLVNLQSGNSNQNATQTSTTTNPESEMNKVLGLGTASNPNAATNINMTEQNLPNVNPNIRMNFPFMNMIRPNMPMPVYPNMPISNPNISGFRPTIPNLVNPNIPNISNTSASINSNISPMPNMPINPQILQAFMASQQMKNNLTQPPQNNQPNQAAFLQETIQKLLANNKASDIRDDSILSATDNQITSVFESEYSLDEENLKQLWSGFITKNKKDRVGVDVYQIRNECSEYLTSEYNLNVSHRTQFDEIFKRPIIGVVAITPQNETQCDMFLDYINYFQEKQRVGVVNLKTTTMYILPPGDISRKFYQNPKKHLLGIFVNSSAEPKPYVDLSNLSLPPPVISNTEKKQMIKMSKMKKESLNPVENRGSESINSSTTKGDSSSLLNLINDANLLKEILNINANDPSSMNVISSNPQILNILKNPQISALLNKENK